MCNLYVFLYCRINGVWSLIKVSPRLLSHPAFWLGCFAVLMMHLGPLISGVQAVMQPTGPSGQTAWMMSDASHQEEAHVVDSDQHAHADHHELMGHMPNPFLPEWVNNLEMCGYCELLTLSPVLMLMLLWLLLAPPKACLVRRHLSCIYAAILRLHASPRAPPIFA